MKRQASLFAAAALALGAVGLSGNHLFADDTVGQKVDRAIDKTGDAAGRAVDKAKDKVGDLDVRTENTGTGAPGLPAGVQRSTKDDSEDIRDTLGEATEASVTRGGFDDLVERFVDADRNRLGKYANDNKEKFTVLDGLAAQIQNDFKAKYGKELDVDHKIAYGPDFKGLMIVQGEIVNPTLLSDWPVKQKAGHSTSGKTGTNVDVNVDVKNDGKIDRPAVGELGKPSNRDRDRNLDKGRNVAIVTIPASHGQPEVIVSMIHELPDNWKIDVPDNIDGQQLHDSLKNHLTQFAQMKGQWPADATEAQRALTHHVLMAIYGMPMSAGEAKTNP